MKKIYIGTTFRDFSGSENDEIQRLFLKSISKQSYSNIELVVTLFGEKHVIEEVEKFDIKVKFFSENINNFRYSLTSVFNNTIHYAESMSENFILLWTTCDVIYDENFFQEIVRSCEANKIGTSHPHITYDGLNNYANKEKPTSAKLFSGFDLIYFDSTFFDEKIKDILNIYKFYDWGVFEHFLIALVEVKKQYSADENAVNIYDKSKISKIENDREITNEPNYFLIKSHKRNVVTFKNFMNCYKLNFQYMDLTYCHLKFSFLGNSLHHFYAFKWDLLKYLKRSIRFNASRMMPSLIKKIIRGK